MARLLVVDDNETIREGLILTFKRMGLDTSGCAEASTALDFLEKQDIDLVVTDFKMPGMDGLEFMEKARALKPTTDVILFTAYGTMDVGARAIALGAAECLSKDISTEELKARVQKVLDSRRTRDESLRLSEENRLLKEEIAEAGGFGALIGESAAMKEVFEKISLVAENDSSVLITGESGTGKELVAREIHAKSLRKNKPFVRVSCGALAESLLESELFGHEKGAFTGSVGSRRGRFELADSGTLFLDEIGDISQAVQVKLLRVLQESEFERVGSEKTIGVDVRILSATNKDLAEEVRQGNFREDLYYRLHVVPIHLPPLRERFGDIEVLSKHLVEKLCRKMNRSAVEIDPQTLKELSSYGWPGNVRELENVLERSLVLSREETLRDVSLGQITPLSVQDRQAVPQFVIPPDGSVDLNETVENIEKNFIEQALNRCNGNKTHAAKMLGLKTPTLYNKMEKYGLG